MPTNKQRAKAAKKALQAYKTDKDGKGNKKTIFPEDIIDILTDLRHFCGIYPKQAFNDAVHISYEHYQEEIKE